MKTVITADHLFTPTDLVDGPVVLIDDGHVVDVGSRQAKEVPGNARHLDFPGLTLAPGFLDIHVHGGAGHDVMEADDAALAAIERPWRNTALPVIWQRPSPLQLTAS